MKVTDTEKFYEIVGKKIKRERSLAQINQQELGRRIGKSRVSVVNMEKGKQTPPIHVIWSIAVALNTSIDRLFPSTATVPSSDSLEKDLKLFGDNQESKKLNSIFSQFTSNANE